MLYLKSHLDQKYDQEVEVSDSSELLKQILGNEVPEGILWDGAAAAASLSHTWEIERESNATSFIQPRETRCLTNSEMSHP